PRLRRGTADDYFTSEKLLCAKVENSDVRLIARSRISYLTAVKSTSIAPVALSIRAHVPGPMSAEFSPFAKRLTRWILADLSELMSSQIFVLLSGSSVKAPRVAFGTVATISPAATRRLISIGPAFC